MFSRSEYDTASNKKRDINHNPLEKDAKTIVEGIEIVTDLLKLLDTDAQTKPPATTYDTTVHPEINYQVHCGVIMKDFQGTSSSVRDVITKLQASEDGRYWATRLEALQMLEKQKLEVVSRGH